MERLGLGGFEGQWGYVDGDSAFNTMLDSAVLRAIASREPLGSPPYQPSLGANKIRQVATIDRSASLPTIRTSIILDSGSMLGVQLTEANTSTAQPQVLATLFTDVTSGSATDGAGLIDEEQMGRLDTLLRHTLGKEAPALTADDLRDASIDGAGQLVLPVLSTGAGAGGSVSILPSVATPFLTPFGRDVQAAAITRAAPTLPPAVPLGYQHVPCALIPCIALTYDDGPGVATTSAVLAALKSEHVSATFFETGLNVTAHPDLTTAVIESGNVVGNHTWDHPDLTTLTSSDVLAEIDKTDAAVIATGHPFTTIMRAPYGATNDSVRATVSKALIHWSVDSFDWKSKNPNIFVPLVLRKVQPGGIVLMHDIYQTTADGQKRLVDGLHERGYALVTVPQLFDGIPLVPGHLYACRGTYTPDTGVPCVNGP